MSNETSNNVEWNDIIVPAIKIIQDAPVLDEKSNEYYFTGKSKRLPSPCGTYLMKAQFANIREATLEEAQEMYDFVLSAIEKNGSFGIEKSVKVEQSTQTL